MNAKEFVESAVSGNRVVVFSKSYCPYCDRAKKLLTQEVGEEGVKVYELDHLDTGSDIQAYLLSKTAQRTVPNIFINQQHVGGSDDLTKAKSNGKLGQLLAVRA